MKCKILQERSMNPGVKRCATGFTLIEVMIVLVVVAVLAAIAYPSFTRYLIRADRTDAHEALVLLHQAQDRFRSQGSTYASTLAELSLNAQSPRQLYTVQVTAADRGGFTATATPAAGSRQLQDIAACQQIELVVSMAGEQRLPIEYW